jgi:filamentous hemagglutinin
MLPEDHAQTASHSSQGLAGAVYRSQQQGEIASGRFGAAVQMDIDNVRTLFGTKYNDAIGQMVAVLTPAQRVGLR